MKKAELKKSINELPSAKQLEQELNSVRYRRNFVKILGNTVASLLVVAAAATLIAMLFLPFLRVTGSSMTPTLYNDEKDRVIMDYLEYFMDEGTSNEASLIAELGSPKLLARKLCNKGEASIN